MTLITPDNVRGPILDLELPASQPPIALAVRNLTSGRSLALNLPEGWGGERIRLDFRQQTITAPGGADRSALLDSEDNALWRLPEPLVAGPNDLEVEAVGKPSEPDFGFLAPAELAGEQIASLAVDGAYIYFQAGTKIGRAKLDGSDVNLALAAMGVSSGLAVDGTYIYAALGFDIGRCKLDGSEVNKTFIAAGAGATALAVNAANVFWAAGLGSTIGRATIAGGSVNANFLTAPVSPHGVAIDATHLYWTDTSMGAVGRAALDGSEVDTEFITGLDEPLSIAVNGARVYWGEIGRGSIGSAKLDGSDLHRDFVSIRSKGPWAIALDATYVYWTTGVGKIGRAKLADTTAVYGGEATFRWERGYY